MRFNCSDFSGEGRCSRSRREGPVALGQLMWPEEVFFFFLTFFFILMRLFVVKFQIDCTHTRLKYGRNLQETHSTFTISHLFRGIVKLTIRGEMAVEEAYQIITLRQT